MKRLTSTLAAVLVSVLLATTPVAADDGGDRSRIAFRLVPGIILMSLGLFAAGVGSAGCLVIVNTRDCTQEVWSSTAGLGWDFMNGRDDEGDQE
ncbi:MAG: hypothetical protein ABGX04_10210 [Myxococcales bacterium]